MTRSVLSEILRPVYINCEKYDDQRSSMSTATGRVFSGLTRMVLSRGKLISNASTTVRGLNSTRYLTSSSQMLEKSKTSGEDVVNEPIRFSTSKASHRTWKVQRSMGSYYERPWWRVLPISVVFTAFLFWCVLRRETSVDTQLEGKLYEQVPGMLSDEKPGRK